jgi:hypothetical protein
MSCALITGRPSSLTATAPAPIISPNSASFFPSCPTEIEHESYRGLVVRDRVRVRHRADGGKASRCRSTGTRRNGLHVFAPGLTEVTVYVNEAGRNEKSGAVDLLGTFDPLQAVAGVLDPSVSNEQVARLIQTRARVNQSAAAKQNCSHAEPSLAASASSGRPPASR